MRRSCKPTAIIASFGLLASVALIGSGCSQRQPEKIVIEIESPSWYELNGNGAGTVVNYPDGTVRERSTPYADNSVGKKYFRPDGTLERTVTFYPPRNPQDTDPPVKAEASWSASGDTLLLGTVYRPDGSKWMSRETAADGAVNTDFYFADGWLFRRIRQNPESSATEYIYYHRDGRPWVEDTWTLDENGSSSLTQEKCYRPYGNKNLLWEATYFEDQGTQKRLITYFDAQKKPTYRQLWSYGESECGEPECHECGFSPDALDYVEVLDEKGEVQRHHDINDTGTEVKLNWTETASKEQRSYAEKPEVKTFIESGYSNYMGGSYDRYLINRPVSQIKAQNGESTVPSEQQYDELPVKLFSSPEGASDVQKFESQADGEDQSILGPRDDSDPCKWFRRP